MQFKAAVQALSILQGAYRPGLQALAETDRNRITCKNTRALRGSVNLDEVLANSHPNDARWDYGIGLEMTNSSDRVVWVEVHPASSSHVQVVIDKGHWLLAFLKDFKWPLKELPHQLIWVASGKVRILANSPQRRKLALAGIHFAGERLHLE
jgi:hypothetical protein